MAAIAVESALGADGAGLKEHAGSLDVAGEAGVVEGDGVPLVPGVDVDAGLQKVAEAIDVAGARRLEDVAGGDFFEGYGRLEVLWVEVQALQFRVDDPRAPVRLVHRLGSGSPRRWSGVV